MNQAFLVKSPDRDDLRAIGDAGRVPICYQLRDGSNGSAAVEYARGAEDYSVWYPATPADTAPLKLPCGQEARIFWWDAGDDLDLVRKSESVKVRVFSGGRSSEGYVSDHFLVGNTTSELIWIVPIEAQGEVKILLFARDAEGDPLEIVRLEYRVPGEMRWELMALDQPLEGILLAREQWVSDSRTWNSVNALGIGSHNHPDLKIRLSALDAFGELVELVETISLHNNHPPQASFDGSAKELDQSFEIPIPFQLVDVDGDDLDVIIQYDVVGSGFPPLDLEFEDPEVRRLVLQDPGEAPRRKELRIATPSSRRPEAAQVSGLRASPQEEFHVFLWDSLQDIGLIAGQTASLRITPFDEEKGQEAVLSGLEVHNDTFLGAIPLLEDQGAVFGAGMGDLDGDRRSDLALALTQAGRVEVFLRSEDGSLPVQASYVLGLASSQANPADLALASFNPEEDDFLDLAVLDTQCPCSGEGACGGPCSQPGRVAVFFARAGAGGKISFSQAPDLVLETGKDARSLAVGNFDGLRGPDLAVSNHDDLSVGFFFNEGNSRFSPMKSLPVRAEPGILLAADLLQGNGQDELAVCEYDTGSVAVLLRAAEPPQPSDWLRLGAHQPRSLAAVDFNGDGFTDLAVGKGDQNSGSVSIFLNQATFGAAVPFEKLDLEFLLPSAPSRLAAIEILHAPAGSRALLALEPSLNHLAFWLVEPAERECFETARCAFKEIPFLQLPTLDSRLSPNLVVGDFDGDGRGDFVLGSNRGVRLYQAEGPGSLEQAPTISIKFGRQDRLQGFLVADFNRDRLPDLAVASAASGDRLYQISLFYQNQIGTFSPSPSLRLVAQAESDFQTIGLFLAKGATSGDGVPDLLALSRQGGVELFLLRNGNGAGGCENPAASQAGEECPAGTLRDGLTGGPILLGDFDGEGGIDLLRLDRRSGLLILARLLIQDRSPRRIEFEQNPIHLDSPNGPFYSMAAEDFDGDRLSDLAFFLLNGGVEIRLQRPGLKWPENFAELHQLPPLEDFSLGDIQATHLNGDGLWDLLLTAFGLKKVVGFVQENPPEPGSSLEMKKFFELDLPAGASSGGLLSAMACDLTGDRLPDLAAAAGGEGGGKILEYYQKAGEGFSGFPSRAISLGSGTFQDVYLAGQDVSGDSRPELLILQQHNSELKIVRTR
ncbi:MAG: FG-GAP repeat protein [Planctomycetes bacterium]|nr:FG-GAP repeat protein [Planctomycetota bacterium]